MRNEGSIDFFGDGMRIFLAYISRQSKKDPSYRPHPIIRAFECALMGIEKLKDGQSTMGVSQDGTEESVYEQYAVVLQKHNNRIEVKTIKNLNVDKELPLDIMIIIFRLQIHLDKIEDETVNPKQVVDALNAVIPGNRFYALGDRWKEARDQFRKLLKEGKMHLPNDPDLIEELRRIKQDTPWEDYSNKLRATIGATMPPSFDAKGGIVSITTPTNTRIEKYKVFGIATEFMLGKAAEYLKPLK